jgi:hypothetical protein
MELAHDLLPADTTALSDAYWHAAWGLQDHLFTCRLLRQDNEALLRKLMTLVVGDHIIDGITGQLRYDVLDYDTLGYDALHRIANLFFDSMQLHATSQLSCETRNQALSCSSTPWVGTSMSHNLCRLACFPTMFIHPSQKRRVRTAH